MANENLRTYLNDHLAGSVAAVQLLGNLEVKTEARGFYADLRTDVIADQQELEIVMDRLDVRARNNCLGRRQAHEIKISSR